MTDHERGDGINPVWSVEDDGHRLDVGWIDEVQEWAEAGVRAEQEHAGLLLLTLPDSLLDLVKTAGRKAADMEVEHWDGQPPAGKVMLAVLLEDARLADLEAFGVDRRRVMLEIEQDLIRWLRDRLKADPDGLLTPCGDDLPAEVIVPILERLDMVDTAGGGRKALIARSARWRELWLRYLVVPSIEIECGRRTVLRF